MDKLCGHSSLGIFIVIIASLIAGDIIIFNTLTKEIRKNDEQAAVYRKEQSTRDSLLNLKSIKNNDLKELVQFLVKEKTIKVKVTGYHPVECQTDSTPNITADNTVFDIETAGDYRYVALSRDLLARWNGDIKFGDWILISGIGEIHGGLYQVRDAMNNCHKKTVDILLTPGQKVFCYNNATMYKIYNESFIQLLKEICQDK